ncbi:MAG: Lpp/OprI family alanine-zipper lipoprotein [Woeseiaceae bacterium]
MMIKNVLKVSAIALVLGVAGGCATGQEERDRVQATADSAARDAAAAKAAAEAARAAADSAAQAAENAQATADEALAAAEEAQSCCDANRDRLERMFQKSMSK